MSLFGKMKAGLQSVANRVTGGYGELSLDLDRDTVSVGDAVTVRLKLEAKAELKVTKITVRLRAIERTNYSDDYERNVHAEARDSSTTLDLQSEVCAELELSEGEFRAFEHTFHLAQEALPSFDGEHLTHTYTVSAEVDIPWGADLNKKLDLQVLAAKRERAGGDEIKLQQQNLMLQAALVLSPIDVVPGDRIQYSLFLIPREPVHIRRVALRLRSVEIMDAVLSRRADSGQCEDRSHHHHDEDSDSTWSEGNSEQQDGDERPVILERKNRKIELVIDEWSEEPMENRHLKEGAAPLMNSFPVPADLLPSYRGEKSRHRVTFEATILIDGSDPIEFCQDIAVTTVESASLRTTFKFGTPEAMGFKDPDLGWIQLRCHGHCAVAAATDEAKEVIAKGDFDFLQADLRRSVSDVLGVNFKGWEDFQRAPARFNEAIMREISPKLETHGFRLVEVTLDGFSFPDEIYDTLDDAGRLSNLGATGLKLAERSGGPRPVAPPAKPSANDGDAARAKLRELLEMGVLTPEEFNFKLAQVKQSAEETWGGYPPQPPQGGYPPQDGPA